MSQTATKRATKGPQFVRYMVPVLEALRELGGSGRPGEVQAIVAQKLAMPEEEQGELLKSGQSRLSNRMHWARFYLVKSGFLDASKRGVWSLTSKGANGSLTNDEALAIFQQIHSQWGQKADGDHELDLPGEGELAPDDTSASPVPSMVSDDHRTALLSLLKAMTPAGFERLCQRLLRETGFQQVNVTGRSGDGGIDGNGLVVVNHLVSFRLSTGSCGCLYRCGLKSA